MMEHKLIAFYEQTLSASEQKEVKQWLEADPYNKKIYEDTIAIWRHSKTNPQYQLYNKEAAWERLQHQLGEERIEPKKIVHLSFNWRKTIAVAASIAVIIVLFVFINQPKAIQFTAKATPEPVTLEDDSRVTLFSKAELLVAKDFNEQTRTVALKGNAFFNIARNADKPFIIHNQDVDIQVLGTSFTIQQHDRFNIVFVHSGKVRASFKGQSVTATARQKIVRDNVTQHLTVADMHTDINEVLKTQMIKVKDIRIDSLANMLEELYNIHVVAAPELTGKKITSTYLIGAETPEQIIENIALTIGASWSKNNNQYIITK